jgi:hypothetical protein
VLQRVTKMKAAVTMIVKALQIRMMKKGPR